MSPIATFETEDPMAPKAIAGPYGYCGLAEAVQSCPTGAVTVTETGAELGDR
jgi:hypothetical protein